MTGRAAPTYALTKPRRWELIAQRARIDLTRELHRMRHEAPEPYVPCPRPHRYSWPPKPRRMRPSWRTVQIIQIVLLAGILALALWGGVP